MWEPPAAPGATTAADQGSFIVWSPLRLEVGEFNRFISTSAGPEQERLEPRALASLSGAIAGGHRSGRVGLEGGMGVALGAAYYKDDGPILNDDSDRGLRASSTSLSVSGQLRLARAWGKFAPSLL